MSEFIMDEDGKDEGLPEIEYMFSDEVDIEKIGLFDFPKSIQNKILTNACIAGIITVILVLAMIVNRGFSAHIVIVIAVIDFLAALNIKYMYQSVRNDNYRSFDGVILSCENRGFKGTVKYKEIIVYNEDNDKYLSFNYSGERTKLREGFDVRVYLSADEPVKLKDGILHIDNYFAVMVGKDDAPDNTARGKVLDDYLKPSS